MGWLAQSQGKMLYRSLLAVRFPKRYFDAVFGPVFGNFPMCSSLSSTYASAASSAMASGQSQVNTQVGITVASMTLDAMRSEGATAVALLESAANVGRSVDAGKVLDVSG